MYIYHRWNKGEGLFVKMECFFLFMKMDISYFLGITGWNLHWIDIAYIVQ